MPYLTPEQKRKVVELHGLDPEIFSLSDDEKQFIPAPPKEQPAESYVNLPRPTPGDKPFTTFSKSFAQAVPSAVGAGIGGGIAAGALPSLLATAGLGATSTGVGALVGIPLIAGGAILGSTLAREVQEEVEPQSWIDNVNLSAQTNPRAAQLGSLASIPLGGFVPSPSNVIRGLGGFAKLATGMSPKASEIGQMINVGAGAAIPPAQRLAESAVTGAPLPSGGELLTDAAIGALFNKPWALGRAMGFHDANVIDEPNRGMLFAPEPTPPPIPVPKHKAAIDQLLALQKNLKSSVPIEVPPVKPVTPVDPAAPPVTLPPVQGPLENVATRLQRTTGTTDKVFQKAAKQLNKTAKTLNETLSDQLGEVPRYKKGQTPEELQQYLVDIQDYIKKGSELRKRIARVPQKPKEDTTIRTELAKETADFIKANADAPTQPNRAFSNFFNQLGLTKRGYTIEADGALVNDKKQPVAGATFLRDVMSLIKVNPNVAGADTLPHEATHVFANSLRGSKRGRDSQFYKKHEELVKSLPEFKEWAKKRAEAGLANTPEEFIATNSGIEAWRRAANINKESEFKRWSKDFSSYIKTRFGKHATEEDFRRVMLYKMYHDAPAENLPTLKGGAIPNAEEERKEGLPITETPPAPKMQEDPSITPAQFFAKEFENPESTIGTKDSVREGLRVKSIDELKELVALKDKANNAAKQAMDELKAKYPNTKDIPMSEIIRIHGIGMKHQFVREAVETATNTGGHKESVNVKYGERPFDAEKYPEVKDILEGKYSESSIFPATPGETVEYKGENYRVVDETPTHYVAKRRVLDGYNIVEKEFKIPKTEAGIKVDLKNKTLGKYIQIARDYIEKGFELDQVKDVTLENLKSSNLLPSSLIKTLAEKKHKSIDEFISDIGFKKLQESGRDIVYDPLKHNDIEGGMLPGDKAVLIDNQYDTDNFRARVKKYSEESQIKQPELFKPEDIRAKSAFAEMRKATEDPEFLKQQSAKMMRDDEIWANEPNQPKYSERASLVKVKAQVDDYIEDLGDGVATTADGIDLKNRLIKQYNWEEHPAAEQFLVEELNPRLNKDWNKLLVLLTHYPKIKPEEPRGVTEIPAKPVEVKPAEVPVKPVEPTPAPKVEPTAIKYVKPKSPLDDRSVAEGISDTVKGIYQMLEQGKVNSEILSNAKSDLLTQYNWDKLPRTKDFIIDQLKTESNLSWRALNRVLMSEIADIRSIKVKPEELPPAEKPVAPVVEKKQKPKIEEAVIEENAPEERLGAGLRLERRKPKAEVAAKEESTAKPVQEKMSLKEAQEIVERARIEGKPANQLKQPTAEEIAAYDNETVAALKRSIEDKKLTTKPTDLTEEEKSRKLELVKKEYEEIDSLTTGLPSVAGRIVRDYKTASKAEGPNAESRKTVLGMQAQYMLDKHADILKYYPDTVKDLKRISEAKYSEAPQIDTPEFKNWFGESKVVDENGKPLVVYHGTSGLEYMGVEHVPVEGLTEPQPDYSKPIYKNRDISKFRTPAHFGTSAQAEQSITGSGNEKSAAIFPVYLSIKNPKRVSDYPTDKGGIGGHYGYWKDQIDLAIKEGYDGLVYKNEYEPNKTPPIEHYDWSKTNEQLAYLKNKYDKLDKSDVFLLDVMKGSNKEDAALAEKLWKAGTAWGKDMAWRMQRSKAFDKGNYADSYVAFYPEQIKSAIANKGTFDPSNPDIRYSENSFLPFLTSRIDKIPDTLEPSQRKTGKMVAEEMHKFTGETDFLIGKFGNRLVDVTKPFKKDQIDKVYKHLYDIDNVGTSTARLTYDEKLLADEIVKIIREPRLMQNALGMKVRSGPNYRVGGVKPNGYMFNMLDPKVAYTWAEKGASPEAKAYDTAYINHRISKGDSPVQAQEALRNYKNALGSRGGMDVEFAALRKAEGKGLPWELVEKNFALSAIRYARRAAKDLAYFKYIQNNPKMLKALSLKDQYGKFVPDHLFPDVEDISAHSSVKQLKRSIYGIDVDANPHVMAAARIAANVVMGVGTAVRNLATMPTFLAPYIQTSQLGLIPKAISEMKASRAKAFSTNAIKTSYADMDAAGPYAGSPDKAIRRMNLMSDFLRKYQGRDLSNAMEGQFYYSLGELLAQDNIVKAKAGNKDSIEFINKFGDIVDGGPSALLKRPATADDVARIAKRFTDRTRGTYNEEGLPSWAIEGNFAPFAALSRFSIEKSNTIYKDVIQPMKKGNFKPFLKYTLAAMGTGLMIEQLNELLSNKRGPDATLSEVIAQGDEKDLLAKAVATLQLASYAGIISDFAKTGSNMAQGKTGQFNNPLSFPLMTVASDVIAKNIGDAFGAINEGEDPFAVMGQLAVTLAKQSSQTGRYMNAWTLGKEETARKEKFRDVRMYEELTDQREGSDLTRGNEFKNLSAKEFKRTEDIGEAVEMLPELIKQAMDKSKDNNGNIVPEKLKKELTSLKSNSYQTMPDPQKMPMSFLGYMNFLRKTQGEEAAQQRLVDYFTRKEINKAKTSMIPSMSE